MRRKIEKHPGRKQSDIDSKLVPTSVKLVEGNRCVLTHREGNFPTACQKLSIAMPIVVGAYEVSYHKLLKIIEKFIMTAVRIFWSRILIWSLKHPRNCLHAPHDDFMSRWLMQMIFSSLIIKKYQLSLSQNTRLKTQKSLIFAWVLKNYHKMFTIIPIIRSETDRSANFRKQTLSNSFWEFFAPCRLNGIFLSFVRLLERTAKVWVKNENSMSTSSY